MWLVRQDLCRGARKGRSRKSSGAAGTGHFLGTVTKARDRGEEDPQDWAGAACSHRGIGLCLLASPPSPQTHKGATCPDCQ